MNFRRKLKHRIAKHVCYTFILPEADSSVDFFNSRTGKELVIRFYKGQYNAKCSPVITSYDGEFYTGYGGRITIGNKMFSIVRTLHSDLYELCLMHFSNAWEHEHRFEADDLSVFYKYLKTA